MFTATVHRCSFLITLLYFQLLSSYTDSSIKKLNKREHEITYEQIYKNKFKYQNKCNKHDMNILFFCFFYLYHLKV